MLPTDFDEIAKTFRRHERSLRALALDQRVRGQSRPQDEELEGIRPESRLAENLVDGCDHGFLGRTRCSEHLPCPALAACIEDDVGEGAAYVDGETSAAIFSCS